MPAAFSFSVSVASSSSNVTTAAGVIAFHTSDYRPARGAWVDDEGEPVVRECVGQAFQQCADGGSDRPVGQQQEDHVGAAGDEGAGSH